MIHNVDAIYDNGVFRPIEPLVLAEGARVHLRVEEQAASDQSATEIPQDELRTLLEELKDFVGTVENLPADYSVNLDHYLYGTPKRQ